LTFSDSSSLDVESFVPQGSRSSSDVSIRCEFSTAVANSEYPFRESPSDRRRVAEPSAV
jgi:hypothetical protein